MDLKLLRMQMTVLGQESLIFMGSIKDNLDAFNLVEDEVIEQVLSEVNFSHPGYSRKGLYYKLEDSGGNLSVGERQILCLVRALISANDLVIFDEATASIDVETEKMVQRVLDRKFKDKTMLVIAHRLSTIMGCDKVVMLDSGEIIESGNPKELMGDPGSRFYRLAKILEEEERKEMESG